MLVFLLDPSSALISMKNRPLLLFFLLSNQFSFSSPKIPCYFGHWLHKVIYIRTAMQIHTMCVHRRGKIMGQNNEVYIPISQIVRPNLTIYESLVVYLKEQQELTFREIGNLIKRDERNIWTVYHRALKKRD